MCYCPNCNASIKTEKDTDPLPMTCPECGSDLYPEEILFQELISEVQTVVKV